jgi:hypothetical protein
MRYEVKIPVRIVVEADNRTDAFMIIVHHYSDKLFNLGADFDECDMRAEPIEDDVTAN